MLSERKRFNYMVNTSNSQSKRQKPIISIVKTPINSFHSQNEPISIKTVQNKQHLKRIQQLQLTNKQLIDQTAKQFKKLESDVHRIQKILSEKEMIIAGLMKQADDKQKLLDKVTKENTILIEAIFEKDIVIKEFGIKMKQFMANHSEQPNVKTLVLEKMQSILIRPFPLPTNLPKKTQEKEYYVQGVQTDSQINCKLQTVDNSSATLQLEDQLYLARQELFDAHNKIKHITQQFEAYKILKQIQKVHQK